MAPDGMKLLPEKLSGQAIEDKWIGQPQNHKAENSFNFYFMKTFTQKQYTSDRQIF